MAIIEDTAKMASTMERIAGQRSMMTRQATMILRRKRKTKDTTAIIEDMAKMASTMTIEIAMTEARISPHVARRRIKTIKELSTCQSFIHYQSRSGFVLSSDHPALAGKTQPRDQNAYLQERSANNQSQLSKKTIEPVESCSADSRFPSEH